MEGFLIPFVTIALAELFDKSQLALLLLASRTRKTVQLLIGAVAGFAILTLLAILAGNFLTELLPPSLLKTISGIIFVFFGIKAFLSDDEEETPEKKTGNALLSAFTLILVAELGDKTQFSTIVFATQYHPLLVFLGALSALSLLSLLAITLGKLFAHTGKKKYLNTITGLVFIILGLIFIFF